MAGWDECAPTISACEVAGTHLPDHGDAWDAVWVPGDADGVLRHRGTSLPYALERRIEQTPKGGLKISYRAEATGGAVPFLWAAHPQFAAPPGTRVDLSPEPDVVVDVLEDGWPRRRWNSSLSRVDTLSRGACRKVYLAPGEPLHAVDIVRPTGERLRLSFSDSVPYLGLWFDNAAYARSPVIAVEPSLGFADSLRTAVERGMAATLVPGEPLEWSLEVDAI
jgi:galactose mutarotase-like enzyme